MKKLLILLFVILAAGAWVGEKMVQDPGYVLISYNNTTVETSIWVMLLLSFFAFLVAHWALNLFFRIGSPVKQFSAWRQNRIARSVQKRTFKGLVALSEGNWWQAQRLLSQTAPIAAQPLLNYLGAAKAAHEQGEAQSSDEFIAKAREVAPQAEVTIGLQEADILLERGEANSAMTILKRLHALAPKHSKVLRELALLCLAEQAWDNLIELLAKLRKLQALPEEKIADMEAQCYRSMLQHALQSLPAESTQDSKLKTLNKGWKSLPNTLNQSVAMQLTYVQVLVDAGANDQAEQFLREQIKRNMDDQLLERYAHIRATDTLRHWKQAVAWCKKAPDNAALLLCTARLALVHREWSEAVSYFERSIAAAPSIEAYRELAKLQNSLGESEKALILSQKAMALTDNSEPLPLPEPPGERATEK
ncbi:MAG: heme biosynthesis HemY N-terminal domain-containing protein [Pseudomonadales bacterium]